MNMRLILAPIVLAFGLAGAYVAEHIGPTAPVYETAVNAATTTVRGQLLRAQPNGQQYPAAQLAVRLTHPRYGPSGYAYSQQDGMYYLPNVPVSQNQQDTYVIEIWLNQRDALRFPNIVAHARQFTDIAPIRVP